jgi:hypothetical protein
MSSRAAVVSSFTIIKGSLIDETYAAFQAWDFTKSKVQNLDHLKDLNSIGASSGNWLRDLAKTLNRRFDPDGRDRPLVELAKVECPRDVWRPILLWHMTRDEFLLRDFLVNWLYRQYEAGVYRMKTDDVGGYLESLGKKKGIDWSGEWTETTTSRVASGLLRIAVDFGLLQGTHARHFASYHLPDEAFLYILHALVEVENNARHLAHSPDWHMYLMDSSDVERELLRLHQYRKLHYEVAGSLVRLELPFRSAAEYARELRA